MAAVTTVASACAAALMLPGTAAQAAHAQTAGAQTATAQTAKPAPRTVRVSTTSDGTQADGASSGGAISADARYVAFWSKAPNLGGDFFHALLLKDLTTGEVRQVPNAKSYGGGSAVISNDGRYVGYSSGARYENAWVYDRETGQSTQVNRSQISGVGSFSADARLATVSVGNRTPSQPHTLFVHDMRTGADEQVDPTQTPSGFRSIGGGVLSGDGNLVAFATGPYEMRDVFVKNRHTGRVEQVDVPLDGVPDEGRTYVTDMSDDGRYVLFESTSANLVPDHTEPGGNYSYLRDRRTEKTRRVGAEGAPAEALSGNGRKVLLRENGRFTLLDIHTGKRTDVAPGTYATRGSVTPRGDAVAFTSAASDLVPDDSNNAEDVFVRHLR
ncbi:hypothetical protein [Streptomyces sp. ODS28]|uniref:TolB family protein n=1 Tax=Streptomyces sp. ODS28 TaxID=3136688 RepID=UPI0031E9A1C2